MSRRRDEDGDSRLDHYVLFMLRWSLSKEHLSAQQQHIWGRTQLWGMGLFLDQKHGPEPDADVLDHLSPSQVFSIDVFCMLAVCCVRCEMLRPLYCRWNWTNEVYLFLGHRLFTASAVIARLLREVTAAEIVKRTMSTSQHCYCWDCIVTYAKIHVYDTLSIPNVLHRSSLLSGSAQGFCLLKGVFPSSLLPSASSWWKYLDLCKHSYKEKV